MILYCQSDIEPKIKFLFEMFDLNECFIIEITELKFMLSSCLTSIFKVYSRENLMEKKSLERFIQMNFCEEKQFEEKELVRWVQSNESIKRFFKIIKQPIKEEKSKMSKFEIIHIGFDSMSKEHNEYQESFEKEFGSKTKESSEEEDEVTRSEDENEMMSKEENTESGRFESFEIQMEDVKKYKLRKEETDSDEVELSGNKERDSEQKVKRSCSLKRLDLQSKKGLKKKKSELNSQRSIRNRKISEIKGYNSLEKINKSYLGDSNHIKK
jgi:hypothetical protein